jgi:hypothetical protein
MLWGVMQCCISGSKSSKADADLVAPEAGLMAFTAAQHDETIVLDSCLKAETS